MKRIFDWIEEHFPLALAALFIVVPFWLLYKICAGAYHLLDKLIDKL